MGFSCRIAPWGKDLNSSPATPLLPNPGLTGNHDADQVPMGTGIAVLAALGGAYLVAKKRKR